MFWEKIRTVSMRFLEETREVTRCLEDLREVRTRYLKEIREGTTMSVEIMRNGEIFLFRDKE